MSPICEEMDVLGLLPRSPSVRSPAGPADMVLYRQVWGTRNRFPFLYHEYYTRLTALSRRYQSHGIVRTRNELGRTTNRSADDTIIPTLALITSTDNGREFVFTRDDKAAGGELAATLMPADFCEALANISGNASCAELVSILTIAIFRELIATFVNGTSFRELSVTFVNNASGRELAVTTELCPSEEAVSVTFVCASDGSITVSFEGCVAVRVNVVSSVGDIADEELNLTSEGDTTSWGCALTFVVSTADRKVMAPFADGTDVRKPSVPFVVDVAGRELSVAFEAADAVCREVAITFEEGTNVGALAANSELVSTFKGDATGLEDAGAVESKFSVTSERNVPGKLATVIFEVTPPGKELSDFLELGSASIKLTFPFVEDAAGSKISVSFKDIRVGFVAARDILVTFECGMEGDVASLPLLVTLGMINVGTEERDAFISENTVTISCCTANRELVVTVVRDDIVGKIAV
ncbi:hypothetical protein pdam_00005796 [Pocillopora damicornis]|uniref:Uncharacterized protein n=1 Tax=Pocillopora damicornis TaxID=46731 RepID=A0A3M6UVF2_POCDA|nr:hypothetical protein pdam_00005796 [Pocillopora damicornis]